MATNHRGQPIGNPATSHGGASAYPYPRLSGHMSRLFNISPMDAAGVIDMHKNKQALGDAGYEGAAPEDYELTRKLGTDSPTEAIQDTIRGRRKKNGSLDNTDYTPRTDPYGRGI